MQVCINGNWTDLTAEIHTVQELIQHLDLSERTIVIEQNGEILEKSDHIKRILKNEDKLEIVTFVGGG
ncbi:sulfur carrier protein ThiS [Metabacillus sp. RGM 3146]|uniref:sulfur carrier protein ThiS n=1 Tax=Metabacillus sp. RGM 3146 TaxID=3401092 RepID=UPI003B9AE479